MRKITIDTSFIMDKYNIMGDLIKENKIIIPHVVLGELDRLKDDRDKVRASKAQSAIKVIEKYYNEYEFNGMDKKETVDDTVIAVAKETQSNIVTNDICMRVKARNSDINVLTEIEVVEYKGYTKKYIDTETIDDNILLEEMYKDNTKNVFGLKTNEYLIIKDRGQPILDNTKYIKDYKTLDILRWDGKSHVKIKNISPRSGVRAKNDLQRCAIDLLLNDEIPVKGIFGDAGCGKTYLATKIGLVHLKEKETYRSIMMVRNPIGPGEKIGFLKGDKDAKIGDFFKPIIQHLDNGEVEAQDLMQKGKLIMEIPAFMKGMDIQDTYILVDEAEDLSRELVKLLGTRVSKGSSIVFTGDYSQSEHRFKNNSGVKELIESAAGNRIFGCVVLDEDLRSETSRMFAELF